MTANGEGTSSSVQRENEKRDPYCPHCGTKRPQFRMELSTQSTQVGEFSIATFFCDGLVRIRKTQWDETPRAEYPMIARFADDGKDAEDPAISKVPCGAILGVQIINFEFGSVQERARRAGIVV